MGYATQNAGVGKSKPSLLPSVFQAVGIHWSAEHYVTFISVRPHKRNV